MDLKNDRIRSCVIAVTGGIATGKSVVLKQLRDFGAVTYSADEIAREITEPGEAVYDEIIQTFGTEFLREDGRLDRSKLARSIFLDEDRRHALESITHPVILSRMREKIDAFRRAPQNEPPVVVAEIPLLYETGSESMADVVLAVTVEHPSQIARLRDRTAWPDSVIQAAIDSQLPSSLKIARADWVIATDRDLSDTLAQTRAFWHHIIQTFKEDSPCH